MVMEIKWTESQRNKDLNKVQVKKKIISEWSERIVIILIGLEHFDELGAFFYLLAGYNI